MNKTEKQELIQKLSFNLFRGFSQRGLSVVEYNRLMKDVHIMLTPGGKFTVDGINDELMKKGWPKDIMNVYSLELIVNLLEIEHDFEVQAIPVSDVPPFY